MKCPNCGLLNPPESEWCDCGYEFTTGTVDESRRLPLRSPSRPQLKSYAGLTIIAFGLLGALLWARSRALSSEFNIGVDLFFGGPSLLLVLIGFSVFWLGHRQSQGKWTSTAARIACVVMGALSVGIGVLGISHVRRQYARGFGYPWDRTAAPIVVLASVLLVFIGFLLALYAFKKQNRP